MSLFSKSSPFLAKLTKPDAFLLSGRIDRWRWPWALIGTILFVIGAFAIPYLILSLTGMMVEGSTHDYYKNMLPGELAVFAVIGMAFIVPAFAVTRIVHGHSPLFLLGTDKCFHPGDFIRAVSAFLLFTAIFFGLSILTDGYNSTYHPKTTSHVFLLLLASVIIFLQALSEEIFFKGYLSRIWGAVFPFKSVIVFGVALFFIYGHWNNEDFSADLIGNAVYFFFKQIITFHIFFRTQNISATCGFHWANNIWATCFFATDEKMSSLAFFTFPLATSSGFQDPLTVFLTFGPVILAWFALTWKRSPLYLKTVEERISKKGS